MFLIVNLDLMNILFGDIKGLISYHVNDITFFLKQIVLIPQIRPFSLDIIVEKCVNLCIDSDDFKNELLFNSIKECPMIARRLFDKSVYSRDDISYVLKRGNIYRSGILFYDIYPDLLVARHSFWIRNEPKEVFYHYIKYGFRFDSIEYCLKYDDYDGFMTKVACINSINDVLLKWSEFEWSKHQIDLDMLSFSAYFGSIKCFKYLFIESKNDHVLATQCAICSGSYDILHMSISHIPKNYNFGGLPLEYCRYDLYKWLNHENVTDTCPVYFIIEYFIDKLDSCNQVFLNQCMVLSIQNGCYSFFRFLVEKGACINTKTGFFLFFVTSIECLW